MGRSLRREVRQAIYSTARAKASRAFTPARRGRPSSGASPPVGRARPVFVTADVDIADVDLRHGAPPGPLHHCRAQRRLEVDPDLLDAVTPLAIRSLRRMRYGQTPVVYIVIVGVPSATYFSTGSPSFFHAAKPPSRL